MQIKITRPSKEAIVATIQGRLDARGAGLADQQLRPLDEGPVAVLELSQVDYISSAGVRIFLSLHKSLEASGKRLILAGLQPYCRDILKISGLGHLLHTSETLEQALAFCAPRPTPFEHHTGKFLFSPGSSGSCAVETIGHIADVLGSRITRDLMVEKKFSAKEYSLGIGGLGPKVEALLPILGEMMTIGGTMVWLPTDGSDMPDYLVPAEESDQVLIHTGFNAALSGSFHEFFEFEARTDRPASLPDLYRAIFDRAREVRADFRGAVWLTLRAEMGQVFGSGVVRAPITSKAPANGLPITDPSNFHSWFEIDHVLRQTDVTGLICGMGLDLTSDLSSFEESRLGAAFYVNPANTPTPHEMLHNHGVFFSPQPLGETPYELNREIARVVSHGDFLDMRHLFDTTTVVWALGGVAYIQEFRPDPSVSSP